MPFKKKEESSLVAKAKKRLTGVIEIDANRSKTINYGMEDKPLTQLEFKNEIMLYGEGVEKYNQILMQADNQGIYLGKLEKKIAKMHSAILKGASGKFGDDADEIEMLGGTRSSNRKPATRKKEEVK